jgi:hypothetical protein
MEMPKKKFDADSANDEEDPIIDKDLLDDEDEDFDAPLDDDLGGIADLDSLDDDDDDDY